MSYFDATGEQLSAVEIAERAEKGFKPAQVCLEIYADQLAHCLATVINMIDPEVIVLGGDCQYRLALQASPCPIATACV